MYAIDFSTTPVIPGMFVTIPSGSTFLKYSVESGWITNAKRLFRRWPCGQIRRGSSSADWRKLRQGVGGEVGIFGQRCRHDRLVHRRDDHEVERLRRDVDDQVGAELGQGGKAFFGDGARDHRLAGEIRETEPHQLGERTDDDVGVLGGDVGDLAAHPADRAGDLVLDDARDVPPRELADLGGGRRHGIGLGLTGQYEVVAGFVEDDVVGELAEHGNGSLAGRAADHDDTGVDEVAGHLGFDSADRPLLEDVGEQRVVANGNR